MDVDVTVGVSVGVGVDVDVSVGVGVLVGVSVGVSVGVVVSVGVSVEVGVRVVVGVRVGVALGVMVGVADGMGVGVFAGVAFVFTTGGTGVSLTNTPRSLIENCRSMTLVSAKLRAAKSFVLPLTEMMAFFGFSMRTYKTSFALHERDVPPLSEASNTSAPSTPTCKLISPLAVISKSMVVDAELVRRAVAAGVAVALPGKVGNGRTVAAMVGIAVGCAPGALVGVRVGKTRVGVAVGCNCAMNAIADDDANNPAMRQINNAPATIAVTTGSDGGLRVKCASENFPGCVEIDSSVSGGISFSGGSLGFGINGGTEIFLRGGSGIGSGSILGGTTTIGAGGGGGDGSTPT